MIFGPYGLIYQNPPLQSQISLGGIHLRSAEPGMVIAAVDDSDMAKSFGIDTIKVRYLNFFIGSALAAVAGIFISLLSNLVEPTMGGVPAMLTVNRSAERRPALKYLKLVGIDAEAPRSVVGQPLGVTKRLEAARALALEPEILLLDEPLAGLISIEAARLADTVADINRQGLTVVMIEHNLGEVLRVAQRLVVSDNGRKIADGQPDEVMRDPAVRAAYVGKEQQHAAA